MFALYRMSHLVKTAGDMLGKKGQLWLPVRTYKNGISSGSNESKITDEAENILEGL